MNMDKLTWSDYLKHMHRGLFLYFISQEETDEFLRIEFDQENAESKDLLQLTILSPLLQDETQGPQIRLKYSFTLYAVRDPTDYNDKLQSLVFDIGTYSANLYRTRVLEDKETIAQLKRELREKSEHLQDAQDQLSLFRPAPINDDPISLQKQTNNEEEKRKEQKGVKRKAPKSLLNPAQKRRAGGGGARIQ